MTSTRHWFVPVLGVLAIPVISLLLVDQLPSPVARHFGSGGAADASSSLVALTLLLVAVTAVIAVGSLLAVRVIPDRSGARTLVATAHVVAVGFSLLHWRALDVQRGLDDWSAARLPFDDVALALLLVGGLAAVLGWWLAGDIEVDTEDRTERPPSMEVEPSEAVVWSGRSGATWPFTVGALVLVSALLTYVTTGSVWFTGSLVVLAVLVASGLNVGVTAGPAGLTVRGGVVAGLPVTRVPLDEIDDVWVEDVALLSYGGIGYRLAPGVRAIVPQTGEGLRVVRAGDTDVVVTLPGARQAAGVLQAHLQQRTETSA